MSGTHTADLAVRDDRRLHERPSGPVLAVERARLDERAVAQLADAPVPVGTKGWPADACRLTVGQLGEQGWNVLAGDLPFPVLVLRESALQRNVRALAEHCERAGVLFAPHGKTTMAPQLFARQLAAGAWALTAATPAHLHAYRAFGIDRILYANELVEPDTIAWLARELAADPLFEPICLVDSVAGVELLRRELRAAGAPRPLGVLLEIGARGGRAGVRTLEAARRVAHAVARTSHLQLLGVECFEGLIASEDLAAEHVRVQRLLDDLEQVLRTLVREGLVTAGRPIVSAGGSAFFDRVIERFAGTRVDGAPVRVVVRSGAYVAHDGGLYERMSPLGARAGDDASRLEPAIEVWSVVQSLPEPGVAITSMGKRDAGTDAGLPVPFAAVTPGRGVRPRRLRASVEALSDQHAHLRVDPGEPLEVGDLVGCVVSHPCTTLDRWRLIPVVDDGYEVLEGVATFF